MDSSCTLDCATFQLSPRRSRCELFVSGNGKTEKLASGLLKPFLTHLKVAEEQAAKAVKSIKLEVEKRRNGTPWFNKGTLERFVRFVSTPEVLELVNTFEAEMSQLEGARRMYSQGPGDPLSSTMGENESATSTAADITKKELLKAIDLRLAAVNQDLNTAWGRASSAGFTLDNVSELLLFADYFGANRLREACTKFISFCQRRPELIGHQQQQQLLSQQSKTLDDLNVRSSASSDMSIDEPELETNSTGKPPDAHLQLQKSGNSQLQQLNTSELSETSGLLKPTQRHPIVKPVEIPMEGPASSAIKPAEQAGASSRRLSVQDRINLFENKQKEQAPSSSTVSISGAPNKVVGGKGEHRRLPSDVSEKSVLRRWSGTSDMSIDLNNSSSSFGDRKESGPISSTPTTADLQNQFSNKTEEAEADSLMDTATSWPLVGFSSFPTPQIHSKGFPKEKNHIDDNVVVGGIKTSISQSKLALTKGQPEQKSVPTIIMKSSASGEQDAFRVHQSAETGDISTTKEPTDCHAESKLGDPLKQKDLTSFSLISDSAPDATEQMGIGKDRGPALEVKVTSPKHQPPSVAQFRKFVRKIDTEAKVKSLADSQIQVKTSSDTSVDSEISASQTQRMISGQLKDGEGRSVAASQEIFLSLPTKEKEEDSTQGIDINRQTSTPNFVKKSLGRGDAVSGNEPKAGPIFPMRKIKNAKETPDQSSVSSLDKAQITRPSKGNQELNDELQTKANELEKLFAAHKLRIQNDQTSSSRRSKPADAAEDHMLKDVEKRHSVLPEQFLETTVRREAYNTETDFDANILLNRVDSEQSINISQKLATFSPSDEFRGKCYDKYMQKRNTKLLEEWGSQRAQKEAKMKAIHDNLELTHAEIRVKFARSADRSNSNHSHRRAEKLRSFSSRSGLRNKNQLAAESFQEEGDLEEAYEQVNDGKDASYNEVFDDGASRSSHHKKLLHAKSLSSSTTRTSAVSISKSSTKSTNSGLLKQKAQTDYSLAQSVPNFSDFRKENIKSSSAPRRASNRAQTKNVYRSKGTIEEANLVKEDKTHKTQSMRTSMICTGKLEDISTPNLDSSNLATKIFSKEDSDLLKLQVESKTLLRKGKVSKSSLMSEVNKTAEASEAIADVIKDEELARTSAEENHESITDFIVDSDSEMTRQSKEFDNSDDPGLENADIQRSATHGTCDAAAVSSKLASSGANGKESPGESSGSWNSHIHHSFSYVHDTSDIDASVDSPIGSPASWNSNPLNQMVEADAARMRKKWGNAQIPVIIPNASQQSRKDVTKGFKRLLKFGRKNRGLESLTTDWVSSTASEGDDDTEDGNDLPTKPSDDMRKSRMGFLHPPEYSFNEGEIYPEQAQSLHSSIPNHPANFRYRDDHPSGSSLRAPRSFFSLSSFRSKGGDSKLR